MPFSNYDRDALVKKLAVFEPWRGEAIARAALMPFPMIDGSRLYLIDKSGAAQSKIRIVKRSLTYDATGEFYRAKQMNFVLGGAFNSRINLNLREDKGYSYGAWSGFSGEKDYGTYVASAAVRTDATQDSIVQIEKEIRNYVENGITESELDFTKNAIGQRDARQYETPRQKLAFLSKIVEYNLNDDFVNRQNEILAGISQQEINKLAKKHLDVNDMIIVVVGDKQAILTGLQELDYEIVELDADGELVE